MTSPICIPPTPPGPSFTIPEGRGEGMLQPHRPLGPLEKRDWLAPGSPMGGTAPGRKALHVALEHQGPRVLHRPPGPCPGPRNTKRKNTCAWCG